MTAKIESVGHYTFDLRAGLRDAAKVGLNQLEEMIGDLGYGWLDSHMESIMERTGGGSITELMKTPSRTQTVKKTRAMTTAMRERTDKINKLNLMAGSPVSKASPSRMAMSPLQPRSLNAPSVVLSPSPLKPRSGVSAKSTSKNQTPLRKNALSARNQARNDENLTPSMPSPRNGKAAAQVADVVMLSSTPKKAANKANLSPRLDRTSSLASPAKSTTASKPNRETGKDDTEQETRLRQVKTDTLVGLPQEDTKAASEEEAVLVPSTVVVNPIGPTSRALPLPGPSIGLPRAPTPVSAPSAGCTVQSTQDNVSAYLPPAPARAPIRQVRSSWLSKALGSAVTMAPNASGLSELDSLRKSYAAPLHKNTGPIDLTNLRKSLAPAGVLAPANQVSSASNSVGTKRPSDGADDDPRPEKIVRIEHATRETEMEPTTTVLAPKTPGPTTVPMPNSASSSNDVRVHPPMTQMRERQRSDIHKVTKALDELRERNAAKEQKAKAATSASGASSSGTRPTSSSSVHDQNRQSTAGSGFLRNLGSIGAGLGRSLGLGGTARSAEEEAQRLAEELEEDRKAELEAKNQLARLMAGVEDEAPVAVTTEESGTRAAVNSDNVAGIALAGEDGRSEKRLSRATTVEREDEDMIASALELGEASKPASPVKAPELPSSQPQVQRQQTPRKTQSDDVFESTTPIFSPPKRSAAVPQLLVAPVIKQQDREGRQPSEQAKQHIPEEPIKIRLEAQAVDAIPAQPVTDVHNTGVRAGVIPQTDDDEHGHMEEEVELPELPEPIIVDDEKTDTEEEEEVEEDRQREMPAKKMFKSDTEVTNQSRLLSSTSTGNVVSALGQSSSSNVGQASVIAGKMLGFKPVPGHVKSLSLANAAAKKTQSEIERRNMLKEQNEARRAAAAREKLEEEKAKAEQEKRARQAELEKNRRARAELERRRKEKEQKLAAAAREKAAKEEAEKVAAKAKAEEEARKRKAAQAAMLNKSASGVKKVAPSNSLLSKPIEPLRTINLSGAVSSNAAVGKLGPTVFRSAEMSQTATTSSSTIALVQPRGTLGPPSRPSQQLPLQQQGQNPFLPYPAHLAHGSANGSARPPSAVLQQSRVQLQTQMTENATEIQSEDIVLPDIASEYSDSDDSDKEDDFKRPQWAESPDLREALAAQANRNPDEIFGPIKPLNMEELFKMRTNKFRARTSSANWNGGDRLTRAEENEYARRMGFKPLGSATQP